MAEPRTPAAPVEVMTADLHGETVFCPNPKMPLWSNHPRVFIGLGSGEGKCPYCGTVYRLAAGQKAGHH